MSNHVIHEFHESVNLLQTAFQRNEPMDWVALIQSKRFWMYVSGMIVAIAARYQFNLDPTDVFNFCMMISALILGESYRPIARKTPKIGIYKPTVPVILLCMMVGISGAGCKPRVTPQPTPAPHPLTAVEAATQAQMNELCNGYAGSFALVAQQIRNGDIKTNDALVNQLVKVTEAARLAAEIPVLNELNDHLPQNDEGDWPDPIKVADYLDTVARAYQRLKR